MQQQTIYKEGGTHETKKFPALNSRDTPGISYCDRE
jgi:hypothetical protein